MKHLKQLVIIVFALSCIWTAWVDIMMTIFSVGSLSKSSRWDSIVFELVVPCACNIICCFFITIWLINLIRKIR